MAPIQAKTRPQAAVVPAAWQRLLPVLLVVAVAWSGVGWLTRTEDRPRVVNGVVPSLQLTTFDSDVIDLAALRGQGVVINFWASWCEPCRVEAELFEAAWRAEGGNGLLFVGVNSQDRPDAAHAFLDEFNVSYPNGAEVDGAWSRAFGVVGLPTTYFVDAAGEIQGVVWGPITSAAELAQQIEKIRPATP
jgi:cytochrome c biogenesis protein CcmG/thiol:disulfide interchange protein DsbE